MTRRLIRRDLADTRSIRVFSGDARAVEEFRSPTFNEDGVGLCGDPDLPIWALHAPLIAHAAGHEFWSWFHVLSSLKLDLREIESAEVAEAAGVKVTLAPCASQPAKRWCEERWLDVARSGLAAGWALSVVVGPDEKGSADRLRGLGGVTIHDSIDLLELARLLRRQHLVVANDCGPMHLAASQGTPTLALFGPTNPRCWFFYKGRGQRVLQTAQSYNRWSRIDHPYEPWTDWPTSSSVVTAARQIVNTTKRSHEAV